MQPSEESPPTRIENLPVAGDSRPVLESLGLPATVADEWARFSEPLVRNLLVARSPAGLGGAAMTVARPLAGYVKIGGVWASGQSGNPSATTRALINSAERFAWDSGCVVVKQECATTPSNCANTSDDGYVRVKAPEIAGPVPDPRPPVPAALFKWRTPAARTAVPYMRQTTDFTCGTAALSMALAHFGIIAQLDRANELDLWRQATTVIGCDPYGLAVTAMSRGLRPAVTISTDDYLFLEDLKTDQDRELKRFIQANFRERASQAGIRAEVREFTLEELRDVIRRGGAAIVLVDELLVHGERCPHWILVHRVEGDFFIAHDPWTEISQGESWVDGYDVPLPATSLDKLAWTGDPPYRAMLALGR